MARGVGAYARSADRWCEGRGHMPAGGLGGVVAAAAGGEVPPRAHPRVGLHTAIRPLLSRSTTGEFNSPPKFSPRGS
eukprot:4854949-Pyramimonas_sp.AAC.1